MPLVKTRGLVLKQTDVGEYDRMLTVFTDTLGKISVSAKGARSMKRNMLSSARALSYSEFVLYEGKRIYTLSQCSSIEVFYGLSQDLDALGAAAYICGFIDYTMQEHDENQLLLRLALNCLYVLNKGSVKPDVVLTAFRLRALCMAGFEPVLDGCAVCGEQDLLTAFSAVQGGVLCQRCRQGEALIEDDLLGALRYLVSAPLERLFSFELEEGLADRLKKLTESFTQYHTGYNRL